MSVFANPTVHADNPPETWRVVKVWDRNWAIETQYGDTIGSGHTTKRSALAEIESGFLARLYEQETRWYAGETIPHWKPYAETQGAT